MTPPAFAAPEWLHTLWALAPAAAAVVWLGWRTRAALARFIDARLIPAMAPRASITLAVTRRAITLAAAALIIIALARPQWGSEERTLPRIGRDVVFLIDVSRSMLAEDVRPNRLERAKLWVIDAINAMPGDRVAIVAFAGVPLVKCPLTLDHGFARLALSDLSPDSVSRGGTNLGDALRITAAEVFELKNTDTPPEARTRDIILISDGGDQESLPAEAAAALADQGVRIIAVGIGDESAGHPIPNRAGVQPRHMQHEGKPVLTRLESDVLEQVALASAGGAYLPVGTGAVDLAHVYGDFAGEDARREFDESTAMHPRERFQWFLLPAALLLVAQAAVGRQKRGPAE